MLRIFLLFPNRIGALNSKKQASAMRMLALKAVGVATLSAQGQRCYTNGSNRAATNEIDPYGTSAARNSSPLQNEGELGNPFPAQPH